VIGLLVLRELPRNDAARLTMVETYQRTHPPTFKGRRGTSGLMVRIPSPISLRIDSVIGRVRALGLRAYRQELVGALIDQRMPSTPRALVVSFDRYRRANAGNAALPRQPRNQVLHLQRPNPGPRP
jgi:hypothetical protein